MFEIITDTSANLDCRWLEENHVRVIPFHYYVGGQDCTCTDTAGFDGPAFYGAMRRGERVLTSQITPQAYLDVMGPLLEAGRDILFVGMSSGISGSYSQAEAAAAELKEAFPRRSIRLVDTLGASLGEGLFVVMAAAWRDRGEGLDAVWRKLMTRRMDMCQVFTVDDLKYLRNTGRLSNMAAIVGTMLNIKPLLKGNGEGRIVSFARLPGRRRAIRGMADQYEKMVREADAQTVGIAHADCEEDVEYLVGLLKKSCRPPKDIMTVMYEPVTGSHVGPGTLALFFLGDPAFRGQSESVFSAISQRVDEGREALRNSLSAVKEKNA